MRITLEDIEKEHVELTEKLIEFEKSLEKAKNMEHGEERTEIIMSLKCEIANTKNELRYSNPDINKKAFDILENGDPLEYIMDQFNKLHIGDIAIGEGLILSIMNTSISNTEGLQPKLSGKSGKGKTHCTKSAYHLVFDAPYKMQGSLTAKYLYYNHNLVDGLIMFSDDIKMTPDLESTLKQAMSNYQQETIHNAVMEQKSIEMKLPKRR